MAFVLWTCHTCKITHELPNHVHPRCRICNADMKREPDAGDPPPTPRERVRASFIAKLGQRPRPRQLGMEHLFRYYIPCVVRDIPLVDLSYHVSHVGYLNELTEHPQFIRQVAFSRQGYAQTNLEKLIDDFKTVPDRIAPFHVALVHHYSQQLDIRHYEPDVQNGWGAGLAAYWIKCRLGGANLFPTHIYKTDQLWKPDSDTHHTMTRLAEMSKDLDRSFPFMIRELLHYINDKSVSDRSPSFDMELRSSRAIQSEVDEFLTTFAMEDAPSDYRKNDVLLVCATARGVQWTLGLDLYLMELFDPNHGVFKVARRNRKDLVQFLAHGLFQKLYPSSSEGVRLRIYKTMVRSSLIPTEFRPKIPEDPGPVFLEPAPPDTGSTPPPQPRQPSQQRRYPDPFYANPMEVDLFGDGRSATGSATPTPTPHRKRFPWSRPSSREGSPTPSRRSLFSRSRRSSAESAALSTGRGGRLSADISLPEQPETIPPTLDIYGRNPMKDYFHLYLPAKTEKKTVTRHSKHALYRQELMEMPLFHARVGSDSEADGQKFFRKHVRFFQKLPDKLRRHNVRLVHHYAQDIDIRCYSQPLGRTGWSLGITACWLKAKMLGQDLFPDIIFSEPELFMSHGVPMTLMRHLDQLQQMSGQLPATGPAMEVKNALDYIAGRPVPLGNPVADLWMREGTERLTSTRDRFIASLPPADAFDTDRFESFYLVLLRSRDGAFLHCMGLDLYNVELFNPHYGVFTSTDNSPIPLCHFLFQGLFHTFYTHFWTNLHFQIYKVGSL